MRIVSLVAVISGAFALSLTACGSGEGGSSDTAVASAPAGTSASAAPANSVGGAPTAVATSAQDSGSAPAGNTSAAPGNTSAAPGGSDAALGEPQWPVSKLLISGLSQRFGKAALAVSPFRQTAAVTATDGVTDSYRAGLWSTWQWRVVEGRLLIGSYQLFGPEVAASCQGVGAAIPPAARLGDSGVAMTCSLLFAASGPLATAPFEFRWSVEAAEVPGKVRVCLTRFGCVRGDLGGNLDAEYAPWEAELGESNAYDRSAMTPPAPMNLAWSLRNMVEQIRDGQPISLTLHKRWLPGVAAPVMVDDVMPVTGREFADGSKGLEFGEGGATLVMRLRMSHYGIAQWSIADGNPGYEAVTQAMVGANAGGFSDPRLLDPLGASKSVLLSVADVPSERSPAALSTGFSIQGDERQACLNMSRINPLGASTWSWCWTHEPSEVLFASSRGRNGQDLYATSLGMLGP